MSVLIAKYSTVLKSHPVQMADLDKPADFQSISILRGQKVNYKQIRKKGSHYLLELQIPIEGQSDWYAFTGHFDYESNIEWRDNDQYISKFFTVGEVTKGDSRRIPIVGSQIEKNILTIAAELDKIRGDWGSPILVTSWYRPHWVNSSVGGARNSQHLSGRAVDVRPQNGDLIRFEQWLDENWYGALGYGMRSNRGFTHLDMRNGKGWKSGGTKGIRWNY